MNQTQTKAEQAERLKVLLEERARRRVEALRIFRPLDYQMRVFTSRASELLVRGGNRSGKSICTAAEVASAATGIPITGPDGKTIPFKYPKDRPLLIWLIGFGDDHVGDTFHRLLFRRNPEFKMIRDEKTQVWRAYRPWDYKDKRRKREAKMAPPFIPPRMIDVDGWAWKTKKDFNFRICRLKPRPEFKKSTEGGSGDEPLHGTEIHAYTSKSEPKMGDPVDLIWIDERIMYDRHYSEWQARISDRGGRIIWSLWPGHAGSAVHRLIARSKQQEHRENPDVEEVRLVYSKNPFISREEKRKRLEGWSEEERMSRDEGELIDRGVRMYPSFQEAVHSTPAYSEGVDDKVDKEIRALNGEIPASWRRDLILDPGHSHPGVLFVATAPPDLAGVEVGIVYDEVYVPNSDADDIARAVEPKIKGQAIESFIIDQSAGRRTPEGFNITISQQYARAFSKLGLRSNQTGSSFAWSPNDLMSGLNQVRAYLKMVSTLRPRLRVLWDKVPNFVFMMLDYKKAQDNNNFAMEKPASNQIDPLCDCIRYYCACELRYVKPSPVVEPGSAYDYFQNVWKKTGGEEKDKPMHFGMGPASDLPGTNPSDAFSFLP